MDCLITGGAGFIGSNLVDALIERGDRVTVLDDLSSGKRENLERALAGGAELRIVDVGDGDGDTVMQAFEAARPEVVFHLAAQIDVRVSVERPRDDARSNVLGTIAVLEGAVASGTRRVVLASTGGGIYGEAGTLPTPEDHPLAPIAPYGQSKHAAEGYCALYTRSHGLSTISLRYGNVYGPRQNSDGEAGVVAIFCGQALRGEPATVFGDGRQTRDWVEVSDVVRANLLAAEHGLTGAVNIGHGRETSVLDLLEALREVSDRPLPEPRLAPARQGEVSRSCLAVEKARTELGWEPRVELHDGLRRVLAAL